MSVIVPPVTVDGAHLDVPPGWTVTAATREPAAGVTRPACTTLIVRDPHGDETAFETQVLPADAPRLVAYTATPAADHDVRSPAIAYSLHLRLLREHREIALNGGAGVAYAQAVLVGDDVREIRTLRDPYLLRGESRWVVLATRCLPDGRPDPRARAAVLVLSSDDLVDWTEVGLITVDPGSAVLGPWGVYDSAARRYVIAWTDESARRRHTTLADLRPGSPAAPAYGWPHVTGAPDGPGLPLPPAVADTLVDRLPDSFGAAGPRRAAPDFPFIADRADPCVFRHDGRWYFIATDDRDGRNEEARGLFIRTADTVGGLRDAVDHRILGAGVAGIQGCFWAPELHFFGGRLHCLFSPSVGAADWSGVRSHVMSLRPGGDPVRAEDWEPPRRVLRADGTALQRDPRHPGISLDMTYVEDAGRSYVAWSQRYLLETIGDAEIWIATIDPARPDRLTSDPVRLVSPEYGWELNDANVVEGPYFLRHDEQIHLTYSAAGVGPRYALGLMTAPAGADLLDPGVWRKLGRPLLASGSVPGQFGPGHNTFVRDDDGHLLLVFHAKSAPRSPARDTGLRRVGWTTDGRPVLDGTRS